MLSEDESVFEALSFDPAELCDGTSRDVDALNDLDLLTCSTTVSSGGLLPLMSHPPGEQEGQEQQLSGGHCGMEELLEVETLLHNCSPSQPPPTADHPTLFSHQTSGFPHSYQPQSQQSPNEFADRTTGEIATPTNGHVLVPETRTAQGSNELASCLEDRNMLIAAAPTMTSCRTSAAPAMLCAPVAIQGQLMQTTDAHTGQTYWLIVPDHNQNSTTADKHAAPATATTGLPLQRMPDVTSSSSSSRIPMTSPGTTEGSNEDRRVTTRNQTGGANNQQQSPPDVCGSYQHQQPNPPKVFNPPATVCYSPMTRPLNRVQPPVSRAAAATETERQWIRDDSSSSGQSDDHNSHHHQQKQPRQMQYVDEGLSSSSFNDSSGGGFFLRHSVHQQQHHVTSSRALATSSGQDAPVLRQTLTAAAATQVVDSSAGHASTHCSLHSSDASLGAIGIASPVSHPALPPNQQPKMTSPSAAATANQITRFRPNQLLSASAHSLPMLPPAASTLAHSGSVLGWGTNYTPTGAACAPNMPPSALFNCSSSSGSASSKAVLMPPRPPVSLGYNAAAMPPMQTYLPPPPPPNYCAVPSSSSVQGDMSPPNLNLRAPRPLPTAETAVTHSATATSTAAVQVRRDQIAIRQQQEQPTNCKNINMSVSSARRPVTSSSSSWGAHHQPFSHVTDISRAGSGGGGVGFANVGHVETVSYGHGSDSDTHDNMEDVLQHYTLEGNNANQHSVSGAVTAGGIHNNQNQHPMIGKPRTTHNVIEKRYRLSINDKIVQLKDMVLGPEVKMNKSGVLQKAIDYILSVEESNSRLQQENSFLKLQLQQIRSGKGLKRQNASCSFGGKDPQMTTSHVVDSTLAPPTNKSSGSGISSVSVSSAGASPADSTHSSGSSSGIGSVQSEHNLSSSSSSDSDTAAPTAHKQPRYSFSVGLTDRSKVTLCMLMLCMVYFNPLASVVSRSGYFSPSPYPSPLTGTGVLFNQSESSSSSTSYSSLLQQPLVNKRVGRGAGGVEALPHVASRVLQSASPANEPTDYVIHSSGSGSGQNGVLVLWSWENVITWSLNALLMCVLLGRVFVYGEPSLPSKSTAQYLSFKQLVSHADTHISQREYVAGSACLKKSLALIGCPVPVSGLDIVFSVIWRTARLLTQRLAVGRYMLRQLATLRGPKNAQMKHAKEVALAYHKLFQLYLTGCVAEKRLCGLLYGLTALTLSDFAYPLLSKVQLVEIVFTCALGCRILLPRPLSSLISRCLSFYGRRHSVGVSLPPKLDWLLSPSGHRFFSCIGGSRQQHCTPKQYPPYPKYPPHGGGRVMSGSVCVPRSFPSLFTWCAPHLRYDPLECVAQHYRQHLLASALHATILPMQTGRNELSARSFVLQNTMVVCGFKVGGGEGTDSCPPGLLPSRHSEPVLQSEKAAAPLLTGKLARHNKSSAPGGSGTGGSSGCWGEECGNGSGGFDSLSFWWASIINAVQAQQWDCAEESLTYQHSYHQHTFGLLVQDMPAQLNTAERRCVAGAVQASVMGRKVLLESTGRDGGQCHSRVTSLCDRASTLLSAAIHDSPATQPSIYVNDHQLHMLALVLCGDVLLATRKELWECMLYLLQLQQQQRDSSRLSSSTTDDHFNNTHQQQQEREDEEEEQRLLSGLNEVALSFHKDLKLLRSITNFYHAAKEKCYFYDTVGHTMKTAMDTLVQQNKPRLRETGVGVGGEDLSLFVPSPSSGGGGGGCSEHEESEVGSVGGRPVVCGVKSVLSWNNLVPPHVKRRLRTSSRQPYKHQQHPHLQSTGTTTISGDISSSSTSYSAPQTTCTNTATPSPRPSSA